MSSRLIAGSVLSYSYNHLLGHIPSAAVRHSFLHAYLGKFGNGTSVQLGCRFLNGRKVHLGERNVINFGCLFDGRRYAITTSHDVSIGPEAAILTLGHDSQSPVFGDEGGPVTIGHHVWIGYRAIILPNLSIGDGAVVAAGAVVTRDVEPFTIVAGSPAKAIGRRSTDLQYQLECPVFLG